MLIHLLLKHTLDKSRDLNVKMLQYAQMCELYIVHGCLHHWL